MKFINSVVFLSCLTWQCHSAASKGAPQAASKGTVAPDSLKVSSAAIEPIPGIGPNNVSKMKTVINMQKGLISFEIYFGGSACRSLHYEFEKRSGDSLIIWQVGQDYMRVLTGFGIKGTIKNLDQGQYRILVMTGGEETKPYAMFEREVTVP